MNMNKETLSSDLLDLIAGLEADLADAGVDMSFDADEELPEDL